MKIKCVDSKKRWEIGDCQYLTYGKEYEVKSLDPTFYEIIDDSKDVHSYFRNRFIKIDGKEKQSKFNTGNIICYNNQYGKIDDVKISDENFVYRINNNWFSEGYLTRFATKVNLENNKEKELKTLQKYLISELNKVSDQLEGIQSNKR